MVYVDVAEEGAEAAAATAILMAGLAEPGNLVEKPVPVFRADRPFLFFIRDRQSGMPLFMGRVTAPPESD